MTKLLSRLAAASLLLTALAGPLCLSGCQKGVAATEAKPDAKPDPIVVTTAPVESRKVERRASVVGTLSGFEEFTMTPKVEGRVAAIRFDVGDRVDPGTVMLELDSVDYRLAVDEAERGLETELARLGTAQVPTESFDIEKLPSVTRARLVTENAKRRADRINTLFRSNAASEDSHEQAQSELDVADATLRQTRLDAQTALAGVRHRQAQLATARQKLSETSLTAPRFSPGKEFGEAAVQYVVAKRMVSVSEMVRAFPSTPVFELVIDNILKFRTAIPERYLSQVRIGQVVEIRVEAWPDRVFPARVSRIEPTIHQESRTFLAEALVANPEHKLMCGGFAKAEAVLDENAHALAVPLDAIVQFAGVTKVFRVANDAAEEVVVRLGGRGPGWVEVIGALSAGDTVVTSGHSKLSNGTSVRIRESLDDKPTPPADPVPAVTAVKN